MDRKTIEALRGGGWRVGTTEEFLQLSPEEAALVEMRLRLADGLRSIRRLQALTQAEVARRIGSSQSRVAKMESADPTVTLDLMVRALLRLGAGRQGISDLLGERPRSRVGRHNAGLAGEPGGI